MTRAIINKGIVRQNYEIIKKFEVVNIIEHIAKINYVTNMIIIIIVICF